MGRTRAMACFLCNRDIRRERREPYPLRFTWYVECPLCGRYELAFPLAEELEANRADFETYLPFVRAHTRQASEAGAPATLTADNFKALAAGHQHTPVTEKLRKVLEYLGRQSGFPGDVVSVGPDDYPLFDVAQSGHLGFLLETLDEQREIRRIGQNSLGHPTWTVTVTGWKGLTPSVSGGTLGTVFVAMALLDDMDVAYDAGIRPAVVDDCGLSITQVARIHHNDSINDLILAGIRAAQVVIADV